SSDADAVAAERRSARDSERSALSSGRGAGGGGAGHGGVRRHALDSLMGERVLLSWSGGKDSALALHELSRSGAYEVAALLTTVTEGTERVGMHAVPRELVVAQSEALGVPLKEIRIPPFPPNEVYEARMRSV